VLLGLTAGYASVPRRQSLPGKSPTVSQPRGCASAATEVQRPTCACREA